MRPTLITATAAAAIIGVSSLGSAVAAESSPGPIASAAASISLPDDPQLTAPVAVSPDGRAAYVMTWGERGAPAYVDVVDVVTGTARRSAAVGKGVTLTGPALTPDGTRLAVGSWPDKSVTILDTRSGKVVKTIPVGGQPDTLFVGPKGSSLFAFLIDTGVVVKIDLATYRVAGRFPTKVKGRSCRKDWTGMNVTPDGKTLLLSCSENGLLFMSTANGRITAYDPKAGGGSPVFSPDHRLVYTGIANYVSVTAAKTGTSVGQANLYRSSDGDIDAIEDPISIAVTPDGATVYATMPYVGEISVLDPRTGKERSRIAVSGSPTLNVTALTMSRDGTRLYAAADAGGILTIDTATNAVIGIDPGPLPDPGVAHNGVHSSAVALLSGGRIGQAWTAFQNDTSAASGFRVLTMNGATP